MIRILSEVNFSRKPPLVCGYLSLRAAVHDALGSTSWAGWWLAAMLRCSGSLCHWLHCTANAPVALLTPPADWCKSVVGWRSSSLTVSIVCSPPTADHGTLFNLILWSSLTIISDCLLVSTAALSHFISFHFGSSVREAEGECLCSDRISLYSWCCPSAGLCFYFCGCLCEFSIFAISIFVLLVNSFRVWNKDVFG